MKFFNDVIKALIFVILVWAFMRICFFEANADNIYDKPYDGRYEEVYVIDPDGIAFDIAYIVNIIMNDIEYVDTFNDFRDISS